MKQLLGEIKKVSLSFNKVSKQIIKYGLIPVMAIYVLAAVLYILAGRFVDYYFAMQLIRDLLKTGQDCFSVVFSSAFFIEIFVLATGIKFAEDKKKD